MARQLTSFVNSYTTEIKERADHDYISARMCYFNDDMPNFFWLGAQAIEKYLKSIALYNRMHVKTYSHDLKRLYVDLNKRIQLDLVKIFPTSIDILGIEIFYKTGDKKGKPYESFEDFLERMHRLGMNRYLSYSVAAMGDELIKLDASVFILRQYCYPLIKKKMPSGKSFREVYKNMADQGSFRITDGYMDRVINRDLPNKEWLLKENFYFPEKRPIIQNTHKSSSFIHPIDRRFEEAMHKDSSKSQKKLFVKFAKYLNNSLKLDYKTIEQKITEVEASLKNSSD